MGTLWQQLNEEEVEDQAPTLGTLEEYRRFVKSRIWRDFVSYIDTSLEDGRDLLETPYEERGIQRTDDAIRGGNEILRRIAEFPYAQIRELVLMEEANSINELTEE